MNTLYFCFGVIVYMNICICICVFEWVIFVCVWVFVHLHCCIFCVSAGVQIEPSPLAQPFPQGPDMHLCINLNPLLHLQHISLTSTTHLLSCNNTTLNTQCMKQPLPPTYIKNSTTTNTTLIWALYLSWLPSYPINPYVFLLSCFQSVLAIVSFIVFGSETWRSLLRSHLYLCIPCLSSQQELHR